MPFSGIEAAPTVLGLTWMDLIGREMATGSTLSGLSPRSPSTNAESK
jgi:hypothetical protein